MDQQCFRHIFVYFSYCLDKQALHENAPVFKAYIFSEMAKHILLSDSWKAFAFQAFDEL